MNRKEIVEKTWKSKKYDSFNGEGILKKDLKIWLLNYYYPENDDILEEMIKENVTGEDYSFLLGEFAQAVWDGEFQPSNYRSFWEDTMY